MKRITLHLAAILATLVTAVALTTTPAHAADSTPSMSDYTGPALPDSDAADVDDGARGCEIRWSQHAKEIVATDDTYQAVLWANVKYRHCANRDQLLRVNHYFRVVRNERENPMCDSVGSFTINVRAYQTWNPAKVTFPCDASFDVEGTEIKKVVRAPEDTYLNHGAADRCANAEFETIVPTGEVFYAGTSNVKCID